MNTAPVPAAGEFTVHENSDIVALDTYLEKRHPSASPRVGERVENLHVSERVIVKARCEVFKWVIEADLSLVNEDKCCRSSSDYLCQGCQVEDAVSGHRDGIRTQPHETEGFMHQNLPFL